MLIITEKPSVAKDFADALHVAKNSAGYYESAQTVITNCLGHLYELASPDIYDPRYKSWRLEDLPIIPSVFRYTVAAAAAKQQQIVLRLIKEHVRDKIVIAYRSQSSGLNRYITMLSFLGFRSAHQRSGIGGNAKDKTSCRVQQSCTTGLC